MEVNADMCFNEYLDHFIPIAEVNNEHTARKGYPEYYKKYFPRKIWRSERRRLDVPDPEEFLPENLVQIMEVFQSLLQLNGFKQYKQLYRTIDHFKNDVKPHTFLTYTCWLVCNYLLQRWHRIYGLSRLAEKEAKTSDERELISKIKLTSELIRYKRSIPYRSKSVCFILSSQQSENDDERSSMLREWCLLKDEFRRIRFEKRDLSRYSSVKKAMAGSELFDHIVFFGHGDETDGFILDYARSAPKKLDQEEYTEYARFLKDRSSSMQIFGCKGSIYKNAEYGMVNRVFSSHFFSDQPAGYFLYGFFNGISKGLNFKESYDLGRLSLILRSSTAFYLDYAEKSQ